MRIPSQFNEDSLYRSRSGRAESDKAVRRLIRLVIALALVVVVMRQAAKPGIYRPFFGQQSAVTQTTQLQGQPMGSSHAGSAQPAELITISSEDRTLANLLVEDLLPSDQRQWVVALSRWQAGRSVAEIPSTVSTLEDRLSELGDVEPQQRAAWQAMFTAFAETTTPEKQSTQPPAEVRPQAAALLAALDDAAAARVVDGSVWRAGDFDSFYRYLDRADWIAGDDVATVGVLPLLQQPDVFRNQTVRAHGTVARAERLPAQSNPYGISEYWQLWLRPADGADRPLVAIVPNVPEIVGQVGVEPAAVEEGPPITIVGTFLKRLAYQSSMGADLAPVVVGRIEAAPLIAPAVEVSAATDDELQGQFWLLAGIACLAGLALAAVAIWRTSAMARRSRELRYAHRQQPDEFLNQLGNSTEQPSSANQ